MSLVLWISDPTHSLLRFLQQYISWLGETAARKGWQDTPLFPNTSGTILNAANVRRDLKELLNETEGLSKDGTPYDLRHTFVTHSLQVERLEIGSVGATNAESHELANETPKGARRDVEPTGGVEPPTC